IADTCSFFAVLYEAETEEFVLTGSNIATSDKIILRAVLPDGSAKADWTYFDLPFEPVDGRTYDPAKSYKFTIICSSSKNGDTFSGAPGSTLIVDDFEIAVK
ncbi:MAG: PCMD domain-containing protein, partial [Prevotellaceae bacterium]|nr:PCMD domain-containing protein [Prevotellaceae bacterium]